MITHSDDGPDFEPDDPLAVILRPAADHLAPPPGRYEAIRRGAARRRLRRTAAGVGLSCAVAALIALPFHLATVETPTSPTVPLAPPPVSSPSVPDSSSAVPTPSESPKPAGPHTGERPPTDRPGIPAGPATPSPSAPSTTPTSSSVAPSAEPNRTVP